MRYMILRKAEKRNGSNPADIDRFRCHTGDTFKKIYIFFLQKLIVFSSIATFLQLTTTYLN